MATRSELKVGDTVELTKSYCHQNNGTKGVVESFFGGDATIRVTEAAPQSTSHYVKGKTANVAIELLTVINKENNMTEAITIGSTVEVTRPWSEYNKGILGTVVGDSGADWLVDITHVPSEHATYKVGDKRKSIGKSRLSLYKPPAMTAVEIEKGDLIRCTEKRSGLVITREGVANHKANYGKNQWYTSEGGYLNDEDTVEIKLIERPEKFNAADYAEGTVLTFETLGEKRTAIKFAVNLWTVLGTSSNPEELTDEAVTVLAKDSEARQIVTEKRK